jgi:hypothetical protein
MNRLRELGTPRQWAVDWLMALGMIALAVFAFFWLGILFPTP